MTKQYPAVTRDDTISAVFGISGDADAARDAAGAQGIVQQSGKSGPQTFHAAVDQLRPGHSGKEKNKFVAADPSQNIRRTQKVPEEKPPVETSFGSTRCHLPKACSSVRRNMKYLFVLYTKKMCFPLNIFFIKKKCARYHLKKGISTYRYFYKNIYECPYEETVLCPFRASFYLCLVTFVCRNKYFCARWRQTTDLLHL